MRTARSLVLKKESLTELSTAELEGVAGGGTTTVSNMISPCPTRTNPVCDLVSRRVQPCLTDQVC